MTTPPPEQIERHRDHIWLSNKEFRGEALRMFIDDVRFVNAPTDFAPGVNASISRNGHISRAQRLEDIKHIFH